MPDHDYLYQVAEQQAGYFTRVQAQQTGLGNSLSFHYVGTGRFERVRPRVYRLVQFPASPHEQLHAA